MKVIRGKAGFTLVELMITVVIVGILAAVAIPIYSGQTAKAKSSEADAALGTVRTALRVYYGTYNSYPVQAVAAEVSTVTNLGVSAVDLNGKYFTSPNFTYVSADGVSYTLACAANGIMTADRTLDQDGNFAGGME